MYLHVLEEGKSGDAYLCVFEGEPSGEMTSRTLSGSLGEGTGDS